MKKLIFAFIIFFGLVACSAQVLTATPSPIIKTLTPHLTPTITLEPRTLFCPNETISNPHFLDISPDRKWVALVCKKGDLYPITKFINASDGRVYSVEDLWLNGWAEDSTFVYLLPAVLTRPSGYGSVFQDDSAFYRLNLNNGETTAILSSQNGFNYSLTTSPNHQYLVYAKRERKPDSWERSIHIRNLVTDNNFELKLDGDYVDVGLFAWSPDGEKVAFVTAGPEWFYWKTGFTIYLLDIKEKSLKILSNIPKRHAYPISWLSNNEILVVGLDEPGTFKLDINAKQLIELTPTPTP